jgi:hypothetical protein
MPIFFKILSRSPDGLLEIVILTQPLSIQKLNNALIVISGLPHFKKVANWGFVEKPPT